ncbi:unnamed protein product [Spirodela intermedia]|uniref:Uncharacterized protein n=1 Tax=Spirodela intermedia TaxID=51605 RepID=A0A7I8JMZ8_SPIIN|nr:unnamed protein product [Spirodela intermedia]CAA6671534.1 unnamed protein product [Spirodela intermedia]
MHVRHHAFKMCNVVVVCVVYTMLHMYNCLCTYMLKCLCQ